MRPTIYYNPKKNARLVAIEVYPDRKIMVYSHPAYQGPDYVILRKGENDDNWYRNPFEGS